jgi:hypothetical protein
MNSNQTKRGRPTGTTKEEMKKRNIEKENLFISDRNNNPNIRKSTRVSGVSEKYCIFFRIFFRVFFCFEKNNQLI